MDKTIELVNGVKDIQAIAWNYCLDECSRVRHEMAQKREEVYGAERRGFGGKAANL